MKKLLAVSLLLCLTIPCVSQTKYTVADIRNARSLIWFGLDFSEARMYGPFTDREQFPSVYIGEWNNAFVDGKATFFPTDLKKILGMDYIFYDLSIVRDRNKDIKVEELFGNSDKEKHLLTEDMIIKIIKKYDPKEKDGIGLVLIVENFDKSLEIVNVWVTYFDPTTKTVIRTRKYTGKAAGAGIIKHWTGGIVNILDDIKKHSIY